MSTDLELNIGRRLRTRRRLLDLSQAEVALACGVTFQQIQKYEAGLVTISASRLWALADALRVPISYFFDGLANHQGDLRRPSGGPFTATDSAGAPP